MTIFKEFLDKVKQDYEKNGKDISVDSWMAQILAKHDKFLNEEDATKLAKSIISAIHEYQDMDDNHAKDLLEECSDINQPIREQLNTDIEELAEDIVEDVQIAKKISL